LSVLAIIVEAMDNASFGSVGHPVMAALEAVDDALDKTVGADIWSLSDDDLADAVAQCERLAARQAELSLRLVREADGRDLGRRLGASSTTAWLRHRLRLRPGEAKARVDLANRLVETRLGDDDTVVAAADGPVDYGVSIGGSSSSWSMPATTAQLASGRISMEHARVVAKTIVSLPGALEPAQLRAAETELAKWAIQHDPAELANLGRYLIHVLDADTLEDREERAFTRRDLRFTDFGDGVMRFGGGGDAESVAIVRAALDSLAAPCPAADGTPDPRTAGQRMFDALVELARRTCDTGRLPAGHGVRPHLAVIVSLHALLSRTGAHADMPRLTGADAPGLTGSAADNGSVGCGWAATPPGELGWGGPISAEAVRRIACDAGVSRVITDPASVPLDVGRETRTVTVGQWAALVVRDRGCAFPGCTRPPEWCIAHHILHWADGGTTDLDNLVLLCGFHHRRVHHHGWDIRIAADGHPEFIPPPWIDPNRTPRRNTRPRYD
jgi:hypothetical protein